MCSIRVMKLWQVDVAGVSRRYVEANTATEAREMVAESLIAAMHLEARRPPRVVDDRYQAAGPVQRMRMRAALDGLSSNRPTSSTKKEIERLTAQLQQENEWHARNSRTPSPTDATRVTRVLQMLELEHAQANLQRLSRADPKPDEFL